jgi:AI-2 transport protein TqsA
MNDTYARANNICLVFLTLFSGTLALIYMKPMLIPLIFSIFVYAVLTPVVIFIQNQFKAPKLVAILFSLALLFLILSFVVLILINSIENFIDGAPKYKRSMADSLVLIEALLQKLHIGMNVTKIQELILGLPFLSYAQHLTSEFFSFLGNLFLVFIFTIFMMTGESRTHDKNPLLNEILLKVSGYISAKFLLSFAVGFLVWIILLIFGIELAFIFAILAILLNFIPTVGSILVVALPLPIVILQYQFTWPFFVILSLIGFIQFVVGNIIEPLMIGDSMDLHPITLLICLIFWGMVWGIPGLFLAVPITAVLKIIFKKIQVTEFLSEILAGRLPTRF